MCDGPTDGWTDGWTDTPSYRDARTHLKTEVVLGMKTASAFAKVEFKKLILSFLDAFSHLYKRVCPSVGLSVDPSVRHPSVRRSHTS